VNLLDLAVNPNITKAAIDGLQDAIRRGQLMMTEEANTQMASGQEEVSVSNKTADAIKETVSVATACVGMVYDGH
jgi:hypothetical protein